MRKIIVGVLILLPLQLLAGRVGETEALKRATTFLQQRGKNHASVNRINLAAKGQRARVQQAGTAVNDYYIFNIGDADGFVIVSGDDRTAAILGYADNGSIDGAAVPDGLRYMLDGYAEQMEWLNSHPSHAERKAPALARTAIAPLIETRWNQRAPYNNSCPEYNGEKTVTGCVATAMAQVMYYHKWPASPSDTIPGYTTSTLKIKRDSLPPTTFGWDDMTPTYSASASGDAASAVATLMEYCGTALQMDYNIGSAGGSSSYNVCITEALKTYFGYDGSITTAERQHYNYQQWVEMIYNELAENRPVVLGGQSIGGGHSFVCDGYDTDDYFHINWGWGGSSDGYFRLSLLNPIEQGVGGSSTLDGFSYGQDAVIGIKPYSGTSTAPRLMLEYLQFNSTGNISEKTYKRNSETDPFTIDVYFTVCSYIRGTHSFDYALQLTDADGTVLNTITEYDNVSIQFNRNYTKTKTGISTPSNLTDGTYYIKVVSRATPQSSQQGTEIPDTPWQECYDGPQQQLTATVSGNTMTISAPVVSGSENLPSAVTFTVNSDKIQGHEQQVIASITGGTSDYHGNVILRVNNKAVMGKVLDIPKGNTVDAYFAYTPNAAGNDTLALYTAKKGGSLIGQKDYITITASDASNTQTLTVKPFYANLDNGKFYGNAVKVTARVINPSTEKSYASKLNCSLREYATYDPDTEDFDATVKSKMITIGKGDSTEVDFEYTGLKNGKFYRLRFTYVQGYEENGEIKTRTEEALITDLYEMTDGYMVYNADGTTTIMPMGDAVDATGALYVDLTGISSFDNTSFTTSSNTNCLYLLPENADIPEGLSDCNVVCGNTANNITLSDGADFYSPIDFTTSEISYSRIFTSPAAGSSGWSTVILPFDVTSIECNGKTVDWFHSATDSNKNFWLRAFTADGEGTVTFDYATEMTAYTPYIIAVPGNEWGDEWQMTGKTVTFHGSNANISATKTTSVSGNNYKFCGNTTGSSLSDVYFMNNKGSKFVKASTSTLIDAFRAWFSVVSISSLNRSSLAIGSPDVMEIDMPQTAADNPLDSGSWYTLGGTRLATVPTLPGIYINKGKKIIIK